MLRPLIVALLLALALGAGGTSARTGGGAEEAYVAVEDDDLVVSVMLDSGEVTSRIPVPRGPRNVTLGSDRRYVLVSSPAAGAVTLIDSFRHRVVETFRGLGSPRGAEIVGRYAYVADTARGEVVVLDLEPEAPEIVGRLAVGPRPYDIAVGSLGLVSHGPGDRHLTVLDVSRPTKPKVIGRLRAGGAALGISRQPNAARAYLTYWESGALGALDWGQRHLRWKKALAASLHDVVVAYSGLVWASDPAAGRVLAVRAKDGRVLRRLRRCPGARGVHFGPGRGHIVAACRDSGTLLVLDPVRERATRIRVGARPYGVAVAYVP